MIVSKDEDFHRLSVLHGPPPKVIWIRLGNCSTDDVMQLLRMRRDEIEAFVACFDPSYRSDQPAHPDRAFQGSDQVRKN